MNDASDCGSSEEEPTWFQTGAPGSVGAVGPTGSPAAPGGADGRCRYARHGAEPPTVTVKCSQLAALAVGSLTRQ